MGEGLLQQLVGQGREAVLIQLLGEVESEAQLRFSNRKDLHLEACLTALFPKVCDMGELVVGKSMGSGGPRSLGSGGPRSHCNYLLVAHTERDLCPHGWWPSKGFRVTLPGADQTCSPAI